MAEPWGEDWRQTALICSVIVRVMGGKKVSPDVFIPGRTDDDVREAEIERRRSLMRKLEERHGKN